MMNWLIPLMRGMIGEGRYIDAIRLARRQGLTFTTARTMANEIKSGARWYRRALYP